MTKSRGIGRGRRDPAFAGSKPRYDEPMKRISISLGQHQLVWLDAKGNRSEVARDLIDAAMRRETT